MRVWIYKMAPAACARTGGGRGAIVVVTILRSWRLLLCFLVDAGEYAAPSESLLILDVAPETPRRATILIVQFADQCGNGLWFQIGARRWNCTCGRERC